MLELEVCNYEMYHAIEMRFAKNSRPGSGSKTFFIFLPVLFRKPKEFSKNSSYIQRFKSGFLWIRITFFRVANLDSDGFRIFHR